MIGGEIGRPDWNSTGPGHADADPPQPAGHAVRRPQQPLEQRLDPVEAALRAGLDPGRLVVMAEDPAVEGRHGDVDAGRPEVGDQDVPGVGPEGQLARRPAAGARPDVALGDQAALDQLADPLGHDRPAEPGPGDQLGARPRPTEADLVEDGDEGVEGLVGQRRESAGHACGPARPPDRSTWTVIIAGSPADHTLANHFCT